MDQDTQDICGSNYMQDIIRQSLWFPNEVVCLINNSFLPFAQLLIQINRKAGTQSAISNNANIIFQKWLAGPLRRHRNPAKC